MDKVLENVHFYFNDMKMVNFRYIKEFGLIIFLVNAFSRILRKLRLNRKILFAYDRFKHNIDESWLHRKFNSLIDVESIDLGGKPVGEGKNYTFIFWWQGLYGAPETVRLCVESIKRHVDNVVIIDRNNYTQWVSFPGHIVERFERGEMSHAHFSDILRFYLLYFYGGVWLDATCFLSQGIPVDVKDKEFWCVNGAFGNSYGWKWTSFVMCGKAGNVVSQHMLAFYYEYWKKYHNALTYLFLDCWLTVLYKHNKKVKDIIDSLPDNGYKIFFLISNLNREYTHGLKDEVDKTFFVYKLTYKEKFEKEVDGKATLYGHLLSLYGITC